MRTSEAAKADKRRPTRVDVASLAGVSTTTVSFVLNQTPGQTISDETKRRVLNAVAQLDYRPNRTAQGLRKGRSATIGFVTHDAGFGEFAAPSIAGAHEASLRHGSLLLVMNTAQDERVAWTAINDMLDRQVDALIFAVSGTRRVALPDSVRAVPTVLVNCYNTGDTLPAILPDEVRGGRDATQTLLDLGHRDIAYLTGLPGAWATRERLRGYRQALSAAGLDPKAQTVVEGNYRADSGYSLTHELLAGKRRPTAIMCGNDRMAVGALMALLEAGVKVPDDISVMGYDDQHALAEEVHPPLSTVRLPYHAMGWLAAEQIFAGGLADLAPRTFVHCPVVLRESTGAPPRARRQITKKRPA
jgi:LacI family transcriptional regulator